MFEIAGKDSLLNERQISPSTVLLPLGYYMVLVVQLLDNSSDWPTKNLCRAGSAMAKNGHVSTIQLWMGAHQNWTILPSLTDSFYKLREGLLIIIIHPIGNEGRINCTRIEIHNGLALQKLRLEIFGGLRLFSQFVD